MKGQKVVHSKGKDDWKTPIWLFNYFNRDWKFGLDAAADDYNFLCPKYFTAEDDALKQSWKGYGNVFVNPPYSLNQKFIEKIVDELDGTFTVVALVPSRTDTKWWHDLVLGVAEEIYFIKGRLKFSDSKNSAPFPSCVLIFNSGVNPAGEYFMPAVYSLEIPKNHGKYGHSRNSSSTSNSSSAKV